MRKSTQIALILLQITALTIFSTIGSLISTIEKTLTSGITADQKEKLVSVFNSFNTIDTFFNWITIILGFTVFLSFIFLIKAFRSPAKDQQGNAIPPLQNYLLELKNSERNLMNSIKEHEAKYSDQDDLNRTIISNLDKGLIVTDTHLRIKLFNSEAEKLFNKSYASAVNNSLNSVLNDYPALCTFIEKTDGEILSEEIKTDDKWFRAGSLPLKNTGYLFFFEDITGERTREEISRKNKTLISLGEMASFLAHEIRNSLGVIYGYTGTMNSEQDKLSKINHEIQFMTSMMENFLNFSRPVVSGIVEKIDLNALLKETAEKNKIQLKAYGDFPEIKSDSNILKSIFSNLFINSYQADADLIEINVSSSGESIDMLIKDNGTGISEENLDKIWLPFFSTKSKGNGMGLAIVKKHLNAINSDIIVAESSSKGTVFKMTLYSCS